ncbi:MAG: lysophospholipid acyltransferase family protein [Thermoguttaceae bacterium]|nr:lysophospholipid acyltransferase family protein [Thermoguttaceae bacterium]
MKKIARNVLDYAVYLIVRIAVCFVQSLSLEACRAGSNFLAFLFNDALRARGRLVDANLQRAFPNATRRERLKISRGMWAHLFLMVAEVARAPRQTTGLNWWRHIRIENGREMFRALQSDRPLILITAHFGNFEMGGYILGLLGYPTFSVARKLDNPYLNDFIGGFRGQTGQYIIDKNEGYEDILTVLSNKGVMAFLSDQAAGKKGVWATFFGSPASTHKAMALLSAQYDAPMFICYATRTDDRPNHFTMRMVDYLDPRSAPSELTTIQQITQWHVSRLEEQIRLAPNQYWWLHNRWKTYGRVFK